MCLVLAWVLLDLLHRVFVHEPRPVDVGHHDVCVPAAFAEVVVEAGKPIRKLLDELVAVFEVAVAAFLTFEVDECPSPVREFPERDLLSRIRRSLRLIRAAIRFHESLGFLGGLRVGGGRIRRTLLRTGLGRGGLGGNVGHVSGEEIARSLGGHNRLAGKFAEE